jgi:hypothetical protein
VGPDPADQVNVDAATDDCATDDCAAHDPTADDDQPAAHDLRPGPVLDSGLVPGT